MIRIVGRYSGTACQASPFRQIHSVVILGTWQLLLMLKGWGESTNAFSFHRQMTSKVERKKGYDMLAV